MKDNKDELRHECALIGLNDDYTDMVLRLRVDIDLASNSSQMMSSCAAMALAALNVYPLFED